MPSKLDFQLWGLWIAGALWGLAWVAGVIFMGFIVVMVVRDEWVLSSRGQEVHAVVTDVDFRRRGTNMRVEFLPIGSDQLVTTNVGCSFCEPQIGDEIKIDYDPQDISLARRAGDRAATIVVLVCAVFVAFVVRIVVSGFLPSRRRKRKRKPARKRGPGDKQRDA